MTRPAIRRDPVTGLTRWCLTGNHNIPTFRPGPARTSGTAGCPHYAARSLAEARERAKAEGIN